MAPRIFRRKRALIVKRWSASIKTPVMNRTARPMAAVRNKAISFQTREGVDPPWSKTLKNLWIINPGTRGERWINVHRIAFTAYKPGRYRIIAQSRCWVFMPEPPSTLS
jgi:hypothetical protein